MLEDNKNIMLSEVVNRLKGESYIELLEWESVEYKFDYEKFARLVVKEFQTAKYYRARIPLHDLKLSE